MADPNKNNRVVWFDIPVRDMSRAVSFYKTVLRCEVGEYHGIGVLEHTGETVGGCLVPTEEAPPTSGSAPLLYLNAEGFLTEAVAAAAENGGEVVEPVTPIPPHGFRAVIKDSEGNRVALHSHA